MDFVPLGDGRTPRDHRLFSLQGRGMNVAVIQGGLLESFQVFDTHAAGGEPH